MLLIFLRGFRLYLDWLVWSIECSGVDTTRGFHVPVSIGFNGIGDFPAGFTGC